MGLYLVLESLSLVIVGKVQDLIRISAESIFVSGIILWIPLFELCDQTVSRRVHISAWLKKERFVCRPESSGFNPENYSFSGVFCIYANDRRIIGSSYSSSVRLSACLFS